MLFPFAEVVVALPVEGRFHYQIPPHLLGAIAVGHRVRVPFGRRQVTGFVVGLAESAPEGLGDKIRPIGERLDADPLVPPDLLRLATFAADYYLATVGEVLHLALPPGLAAASRAEWTITHAGRHFLDQYTDRLPNGERLTTSMRQLLEAAVQKAVRPKDTSLKVATELEALGFIARKERTGSKGQGGEVWVLERVATAAAAEAHLARAKTQRRLFERLADGPVELEVLAQELGRRPLQEAAKKLEADRLIRRRRTPTAPSTRDPRAAGTVLEALPDLTEEQAAAHAALSAAIDAKAGGAVLLHGVTASGKTEVYLRTIQHAQALGLGAIVLVPEIALTPQLEQRFTARFGDRIAVLHSGLPDRERRRHWQRLASGEAQIAIGARSAIWAPVGRLGVIVVDEEHDPSFKQSSDVRYSGRDLALVRGHQARALVVLGSATPSLEAQHLVEQGRMQVLRLRKRVGDRPLPKVQVVDLVEERRRRGEAKVISQALGDRLQAVVGAGEQAILFLNRRGFNTIVYCEDCGAPRSCLHCDVSLTYHKAARVLSCHYCEHQEPLSAPCKHCQSRAVQPFGAGTERVVEAVHELLPDARVLRLDRDVTARAGALDEILGDFRARRADILVGTQMVTKGHDFPGVTLVGVMLADASLAFPDFRAAERTFQLLTQVAGRAGRASDPGVVLIQAMQRDHYAITCAVHHDSDRFFELERTIRENAGYPPYGRMALIRIESKDEALLRTVAEQLRETAGRVGGELRIRGPVPAPIPRVRERHRQMLMILAATPARLVDGLRRIKHAMQGSSPRVELIFDVDPVDLL